MSSHAVCTVTSLLSYYKLKGSVCKLICLPSTRPCQPRCTYSNRLLLVISKHSPIPTFEPIHLYKTIFFNSASHNVPISVVGIRWCWWSSGQYSRLTCVRSPVRIPMHETVEAGAFSIGLLCLQFMAIKYPKRKSNLQAMDLLSRQR